MSIRSVLITGGTGSFGHACVRALLSKGDGRTIEIDRVIVFSRDELKQSEMREAFPDPRLEFFLGDVRDEDRLRRAFQAQPDLIIHAAALKQVPSCEYNPFEAVKTNVLGAMNVIEAALDCDIPKVVALSTDKAASPLNAYGKTKALAESLFVRGNAYAGRRSTRFAVVRYGNVIGSRGSVIPRFLEHQRIGTAIPITDRRMTRFWMPLEQAVELVLETATIMQGGEIVVPEIPSANIVDIAARVAPRCGSVEMGLRPGEKLHETLISEDEARQAVIRRWSDGSHVYVIEPVDPSWPYHSIGTPVPAGFSFRSDSQAALQLELAGIG